MRLLGLFRRNSRCQQEVFIVDTVRSSSCNCVPTFVMASSDASPDERQAFRLNDVDVSYLKTPAVLGDSVKHHRVIPPFVENDQQISPLRKNPSDAIKQGSQYSCTHIDRATHRSASKRRASRECGRTGMTGTDYFRELDERMPKETN